MSRFTSRVPSPGYVWGLLSRKRPIAPTSQRRSPIQTPSGKCSQFNKEFFYFIYQGLGVSIPLAVGYAIPVIFQVMAGDKIAVALVLAMVGSLLAGVCLSALVSGSRECSGNVCTAIYQLVGEFPAYVTGALLCFMHCACLAAMTKAMSSTLDEMSKGTVYNFFKNTLGVIWLSGEPPDGLAFGAAVVTSGFLACGLQQAGFLRAAMNISSLVAFLFSLVIGATADGSSSKSTDVSYTYNRALVGAGVCCTLFTQSLELGRRWKKVQNSHLNLPLAILFSCFGIFTLCVILGILYTVLDLPRGVISGAILVRYLRIEKYEWSGLILGLIQITICGLGISEAGEIFGRQIVCMASNGFIPSYLSKESSQSFSHSRALLAGGTSASLLALLTTHSYLLELMAANLLLLNVTIILIILYRPFRCTYGEICSIAVTPSSRKAFYKEKTKTSFPWNKIGRKSGIFSFFKRGQNRREHITLHSEDVDDDETPLISSLMTANEGELQDDGNTGSLESLCSKNVTLELQSENEDDSKSSENEMNENYEDIHDIDKDNSIEMRTLTVSSLEAKDEWDYYLEDEDIDAIISEYKEKLRKSGPGIKSSQFPTKTTARIALLCIFILITTILLLSFCSINYLKSSDFNEQLSVTKKLLALVAVTMIIVALMILLNLPNTTHSSAVSKFHHRCHVIMAFTALLFNSVLLLEVIIQVKWICLALYLLALAWYAFYSVRESAASISVYQTNYVSTSRPGATTQTLLFSSSIPVDMRPSNPQLQQTFVT